MGFKRNLVAQVSYEYGTIMFTTLQGKHSIVKLNDDGWEFVQCFDAREKNTDLPAKIAIFVREE